METPQKPSPDDGQALASVNCSALTLRDYFAAAVMQGWQACANTNASTPEAVKYCYEVADEMLKQRDGQNEKLCREQGGKDSDDR